MQVFKTPEAGWDTNNGWLLIKMREIQVLRYTSNSICKAEKHPGKKQREACAVGGQPGDSVVPWRAAEESTLRKAAQQRCLMLLTGQSKLCTGNTIGLYNRGLWWLQREEFCFSYRVKNITGVKLKRGRMTNELIKPSSDHHFGGITQRSSHRPWAS